MCEEIWNRLGNESSVSKAKWPVVDESKLVESTVKIAVQVNGKLRGELAVEKGESKENILAAAKQIENVKNFLSGKTIVKEIFVPGKIVNIVAK